jgi:hypothetical protein
MLSHVLTIRSSAFLRGGIAMHYEQIIRGEIAIERIERIANACSRAGARRRGRARRHMPWAAGLESAGRARRSAAKPELQG